MVQPTTPRQIAQTVWENYYDNPLETTMGDVALETNLSRAQVRKAVQSLVQVDLLRPHPAKVGLYEHDHYDDPATAFEEAFPMTNTETTDRDSSKTTIAAFPDCNCGCGEAVQGKKAQYRPGHDARHAGNVGRALAALPDTATTNERHEVLAVLPSQPLRDKALRVEDKARTKASRKTNRAPRKPRSAVDAFTEGEVKVGRWTYPARTYSTGKVERNTRRDGSGEWVAVED